MGVDEYAELVCPLPVIRLVTDENGDADHAEIDPCCEPLFVNHTDGRYLLVGGECDGAGPTWEVVCGGGHTLVPPDYMGNEPSPELGLNAVLHLVQESLEALGTTAKDNDGGMAFAPLPGTEGA